MNLTPGGYYDAFVVVVFIEKNTSGHNSGLPAAMGRAVKTYIW